MRGRRTGSGRQPAPSETPLAHPRQARASGSQPDRCRRSSLHGLQASGLSGVCRILCRTPRPRLYSKPAARPALPVVRRAGVAPPALQWWLAHSIAGMQQVSHGVRSRNRAQRYLPYPYGCGSSVRASGQPGHLTTAYQHTWCAEAADRNLSGTSLQPITPGTHRLRISRGVPSPGSHHSCRLRYILCRGGPGRSLFLKKQPVS
uniref:Uncharacterized protein n=1 Tax=Candidatus Methanogaster sp. ANME-2c ERB4 TaxID=2759911 RepID=A0A7G9Y6B0_9EURY|nr:hypothetical protein HMEJMANM_00013 [Methanosarcinales archaeon ANME-2c ERB4]QNO43631.1 hypothetical protein LAPIAFBC_00038 [Methanosarcinales archaeon ANME-2c ERB4]QNO44675.1 hypothetical protein FAIAHACK_00012 [Methanosarcinales archaeon ANME-2c ERB4]